MGKEEKLYDFKVKHIEIVFQQSRISTNCTYYNIIRVYSTHLS